MFLTWCTNWVICNPMPSHATEDQNNLFKSWHAPRLSSELAGWNGKVYPPYCMKLVLLQYMNATKSPRFWMILFYKQKGSSKSLLLTPWHDIITKYESRRANGNFPMVKVLGNRRGKQPKSDQYFVPVFIKHSQASQIINRWFYTNHSRLLTSKTWSLVA